MTLHIAIVEDELMILKNYQEALRRQGYRVSGFSTRGAAERAFREHLPDLVIIDVGLADDYEGGFELCRWLRSRSDSLPILFLSARDCDLDTISGLRLGADDYLSKDISLAHLSVRISSLFRRRDALLRKAQSSDETTLRVGKLLLDSGRFEVHWQDRLIPLTVTEFWMLAALVRHPGHVKSRAQLMQAAQLVVDEQTITSHIKRMRQKFIQADPSFDAIETLYGIGYRFSP